MSERSTGRRNLRKRARVCYKQDEHDSDVENTVETEEVRVDTRKNGGEKTSEKAMKTVICKGVAPVDSECLTKLKTAHVYQENGVPFDVMLNQTNVSNNNNKFFIIQLLEDDGKQNYSVWFRWGRVGYHGQNNLNEFGSNLEQAKQLFMKKFQDKTKNLWSERENFVKYPGKYDLVQIDYGSVGATETEEDSEITADTETKIPDSQLDERIQKLISLICNLETWEDTVRQFSYDSKKLPLGKLTERQIRSGYEALAQVERCIRAKKFGRNLFMACSEFYTRIPHYFGMRPPALLRDQDDVDEKMRLLDLLRDIESVVNVISRPSKMENPIDRNYSALDMKLSVVEHDSADFRLIESYIQRTHAPTHSSYRLVLRELFAIKNKRNPVKEKPKAPTGARKNRMLLWHGSRLSNYCGILKQGLRIAPLEAPVTGYMFGKGVYFADVCSKSANYCFATPSNPLGLLLLCEVSLGNQVELATADYQAGNLPPGKHSVIGLGKTVPNRSEWQELDDGTWVPCGSLEPRQRPVDKPKNGDYSLLYNDSDGEWEGGMAERNGFETDLGIFEKKIVKCAFIVMFCLVKTVMFLEK